MLFFHPLRTAALVAKTAFDIKDSWCSRLLWLQHGCALFFLCAAQVSIPTQGPAAKAKSDPLSLDYSHCCSRMSGGSQRDNEGMGWAQGQPVGPRKVVRLWC